MRTARFNVHLYRGMFAQGVYLARGVCPGG